MGNLFNIVQRSVYILIVIVSNWPQDHLFSKYQKKKKSNIAMALNLFNV